MPRQLQLSLLRLKDNDHPFRVIDSYIHRHGTFLSEPNRSLICVSVSMHVRVFLFCPRLDYIKIERWNADDCNQNSESTQTKGGSDATQKFLYGSQPNLFYKTEGREIFNGRVNSFSIHTALLCEDSPRGKAGAVLAVTVPKQTAIYGEVPRLQF